MRPIVSGILPVRNGIKWINKSLHDINLMLRKDDELVIIDDGSTDGTKEFLSQIRMNCNYKVIFQESLGLVTALNAGIKVAKSDWIVRFDVDDKYDLNRIDEMMRVVEISTVAIFSDFKAIGSQGENLGDFYSAIYDSAIKLSLPRSERNAHPSVIFRKKAAIEVGQYRQEDFPCEDLSLWLRLSKRGSMVGVPKTLLYYQIHPRSVSYQNYELIAIKKREIIQKHNFLESIEDCVRNLQATLNKYKSLPHSSQRQILHLRDFYEPSIWEHLNTRNRLYISLKLILLLSQPPRLAVLFSMQIQRMRRRKYRKSNLK